MGMVKIVELLDHGLLSVREYELLKQHILTDLLSTAQGRVCFSNTHTHTHTHTGGR